MTWTRRSRAVALLAAAVLLAAACASDDDSAVAVTDETAPSTLEEPVAGDPAAGVPTPAPEGASPSTDVAAGPPSPTTRPSGGTAPTDPSAAGPPPPPTASAPSPGAVGAFAPFYLRPAESARVVLDLRSQAGAEPLRGTVDHLQQVIGRVSGKPVDTSGGVIGGSGRQWTSAEIQALADEPGLAQSRAAAVMHVFFLSGGFAESDSVIGVAVRSDVAAIFSDRVDEAAGLVGGAARIEDAVTMHEVGHLLGLVDLFLRTGRGDPEHPGHSPNRDSVMYFAVESTLVGTLLSGGPPVDFDRADLADLATIRNG